MKENYLNIMPKLNIERKISKGETDMRRLPIYKYLDISTAHITPETDEFLWKQLGDEYSELIVYRKIRGYFINVPDLFDLEEMAMPSDLRKCLEFAIKHNCFWLVLDGDAEVIDELETYEW